MNKELKNSSEFKQLVRFHSNYQITSKPNYKGKTRIVPKICTHYKLSSINPIITNRNNRLIMTSASTRITKTSNLGYGKFKLSDPTKKKGIISKTLNVTLET